MRFIIIIIYSWVGVMSIGYLKKNIKIIIKSIRIGEERRKIFFFLYMI